MSLKFTEELLYVMKMKNNATFEDELTCRFKIDMGNFMNFDANTSQVSKMFTLMCSF